MLLDHPSRLHESAIGVDDVKFLDNYIADKSYMIGYEPSAADTKVFDALDKTSILHDNTSINENDHVLNPVPRVTQQYPLK